MPRDVEHVVDDLEAHPEVRGRTACSASSVSADTSLTIPPMRHAVAMSDAVLPSIDEKYDSSERSASKRYCSSST